MEGNLVPKEAACVDVGQCCPGPCRPWVCAQCVPGPGCSPKPAMEGCGRGSWVRLQPWPSRLPSAL